MKKLIILIIIILLFCNKKYEYFDESILNNLYVISGGMNSSNRSYVYYNNKIIISNGSMGMNIVIIDKNTKKIKNSVNINTAEDYLQNDVFIELVQNHILKTDIVIITVKGDAFQKMNTESRFYLKQLGSKISTTKGDASYILIGSKDKSVYYEQISWSYDVYFPYITYNNLGCWKKISNIVTNELQVNKLKECLLEASKNNTNMIGYKNNKCYLLKPFEDYKTNGISNNCNYRVYQIENKFITNKDIDKYDSNYVTIYSEENYKGNSMKLDEGVYTDILSKNTKFIQLGNIEMTGGLVYNKIKSIKIPKDFMIIISDHYNFRRAIRYYIHGNKNLMNLRNYRLYNIRKIIVVKTKYKVIFWDKDNFMGNALALSYGKYVIPEELQLKINSINIKLPKCKISMFYDKNFSEMYGVIKNKENILNMNNDRYIKSIIIEYNNK
jgi:hypothetical protein